MYFEIRRVGENFKEELFSKIKNNVKYVCPSDYWDGLKI